MKILSTKILIEVWKTKGLIIWDRYEVRPSRLEITLHTNPCSCLYETSSENKLGPISLISGAGPTRMSSSRFELELVRNFLHEKLEISPDHPLMKQRTRKTLLLGTKTRNADWNVCKNIALVSFQSHVNTSECFHFDGGLNSCRSHVINP